MRLAIVHKEKCSPEKCENLCVRLCPVNRTGKECILIDKKAWISEELCVGCGICQNRCPFKAISIVNLPDKLKKDIVHRYGENGFALYNLPVPKFGTSIGFLGRNGIGKTTALDILGNKLKMNLGADKATEKQIKEFFKGSELLNYFEKIAKLKISIKPQNLIELAVDVKVSDFMKKFAKQKEIDKIMEKLGISYILDRKLNQVSGGELQKIAIAAASIKEADVYYFDEPLAFLDITERIKVSNFISELVKKEKAVIVIEHDLLLLDYITDLVNIFYGEQGCYGIVADVRASKRAINTYLSGKLREENVRFRDKPIVFDFSVKRKESNIKYMEWPDFNKTLGSFKLKASEGTAMHKNIIGIAGKNGIGKTTFVKCLASVLETDEKNLNLKLKVSYKPQYLEATNDELVAGIVKKEKIDNRLISLFSLSSMLMKTLKQLSGGELQRLAIASCLAKDADIYLFDEPSAYLDVEERLHAARAIEETIMDKEKAAFVVDHDLLFLTYLADSLIVFTGQPGKQGIASKPYELIDGMNVLLKELDITLRKDDESGRPRINKKGSVLDREQRKEGNYIEV
jgi:ATP-binding cassette subfamily E protein 1